MRVVLDTNVIISGLLSKGPASHIFDLIEDGKCELCLTPLILDELKRVLQYSKLIKPFKTVGITPEEALVWLLQNSVVYPDLHLVKLIKEDPSDDIFINCAIASNSKWIVSGDKHLLKLGSYELIKIVSPRIFIR